MSAPQQSSIRNQLLAGLPPEDFDALQAHLEPVELELKQVLIEPNQPIEHVYFPQTGYTSIVTSGQGSTIELGLIGREGLVGVSVALGVRSAPFLYFVQHPGEALRIATSHLEEVIDDRPSVHRVLLRYAQALNVQTSGTAFTNAKHTLETRLARWLLMCHDRVDGTAGEVGAPGAPRFKPSEPCWPESMESPSGSYSSGLILGSCWTRATMLHSSSSLYVLIALSPAHDVLTRDNWETAQFTRDHLTGCCTIPRVR